MSRVNPDVLLAWCEAPSHFLPPELPAAPAQHSQSAEASPQRHRYSPAEISQQSVDLLLREYYAMVTAQRQSGAHKHEGSQGILQQAFLLVCPAPPAALELDRIFKASLWLIQTTARSVALLACFLIPLLLQVIRETHKQQGPIAAAAMGVGCGLVLLCCDAVSRGLRRQAAAQQAACVTADTLQQCLQGVDSSLELATLRASSKTATTSNSTRPNSVTHQQHAARHQPAMPNGRRPSASDSSGPVVTSYAQLEPGLAALQASLGVSVSSSHAPGSREHGAEVLGQLSQQLGVQLSSDALLSPAGMGAAVTQLKQSIGI